VGHK